MIQIFKAIFICIGVATSSFLGMWFAIYLFLSLIP